MTGNGRGDPVCTQTYVDPVRRGEGGGSEKIHCISGLRSGGCRFEQKPRKNTGNMRFCVLYCFNECKGLICVIKEEENEFTGRKVRT